MKFVVFKSSCSTSEGYAHHIQRLMVTGTFALLAALIRTRFTNGIRGLCRRLNGSKPQIRSAESLPMPALSL